MTKYNRYNQYKTIEIENRNWPNNLLNKLGSLKATKNASEIKPAPITLAIRRSLK